MDVPQWMDSGLDGVGVGWLVGFSPLLLLFLHYVSAH